MQCIIYDCRFGVHPLTRMLQSNYTRKQIDRTKKKNEIKRENGHLELIASQVSHKSNEYTSVELFLAVHCMDMVNNFVFQFSIKLCIILKSKGYWLFVSHLILSMEREVHWSHSMPAPFFSLLLALFLQIGHFFSGNLFSFC